MKKQENRDVAIKYNKNLQEIKNIEKELKNLLDTSGVNYNVKDVEKLKD